MSRPQYERSGLGALYAFTPFKLIYTTTVSQQRDSNVMLFWYPRGTVGLYYDRASEILPYPLSEAIKKCEKLEKLWRVPLRDKVRGSIYLYSEFPAVEFSPTSDKYVLVIDRNLYEYFTGRRGEEEVREALKKKIEKRSTFILAEFSYRSINEPNFCRLGLVLITHRAECTIANLCPLRSSQGSRMCGYFLKWSRTRETYAGLYKVMAELGLEVTEPGHQSLRVVRPLLVLPYKGRPLLEITFVDPVNILAYYKGVNFIPKKYVERLLRASFSKTLGIRLYLTSAFKISFVDKVLEEVVNDVLNDQEAGRWLRFKAGLFLLSNALLGSSAKRVPLKPWRKLEELLCRPGSLEKIKKLLNETLNPPPDEMRKAVKFIIVHTIAHVIVLSLWSFLGLSENEIGYIITTDNDGFSVWVFEAASGGYGYLKYLAENRDKLYELLTQAFTEAGSETAKEACTTSISSEVIKSLENLIDSVERELAGGGDGLRKVYENLRKLLRNSMYLHEQCGVTPHIYTMHSCVTRIVPGALREALGKVIDKLYSIFHQFDGTVGRYYLEEGCSMGPFLQPFSVSCSTAYALAGGMKFREIRERLKKYVIAWIERAKSRLDIITWVISIHDYDEMLKAMRRAVESGAKIRVLLGKGAVNDESSIKSVERLYREFDERIDIRLYTEAPLHRKAIVIDDVALIEGSFNLTKSALTKNIESAHIIVSPDSVVKCREEFDKLWGRAKPVKTGEDLKPKSWEE